LAIFWADKFVGQSWRIAPNFAILPPQSGHGAAW
jgi:hypothetical protein